MSDPVAATATTPGPRPRYKRKLANYLLDKKLQLRYVVIITVLSGAIAGTLGYTIYDQQAQSTTSIENKLEELTDKDDAANITGDYESEDRALVYKMVGVGIGLVVILSLYLLIMTHKVAGPLYKISSYFDRMSDGRLGNVSALRKGDMLQDFFGNFREMHEAVRTRMQSDVITMESAANALRTKGDGKALAEALDTLDKHITQRKKQLL